MDAVFDHNDPKYRCCCSLMHIKTASQLAGTFLIFGTFFSLAADIFMHTFSIPKTIIILLQLIPIILLFVGIHKKRPRFLLVQLIFMTVVQILLIVWVTLCLILLIDLKQMYGSNLREFMEIVILTVLNFWFLRIFFKCYKYLKHATIWS